MSATTNLRTIEIARLSSDGGDVRRRRSIDGLLPRRARHLRPAAPDDRLALILPTALALLAFAIVRRPADLGIDPDDATRD